MLLDEADPRNAVEGSQIKNGISVRAILPSGTLRFASYFQFRVFQLAPVLRELDSKSGEDLLKDDPTVSSFLSKFPDGEESIDPRLTQNATSGTHYVIGDQSTGPSSNDDTAINELLKRKESATVFAQIDQLNDPRLKPEALLKLSMACAETCSDQSETALEHLILMRDKIDPRNVDVWLRATDVALNLHKSEIAAQLIDLAGKAGLSVLQDDSNPDDPNLVLKLYWPATMEWKNVIATAKKISTSKANQMLTLIPDPEIRAVERNFLAAYLLGVPVWNDESPIVAKKSFMVH